jgi:hypothetical protein
MGLSKAQQSPNNLHFRKGKLDKTDIPVLNPQLDDFSFLLGLIHQESWMISRLRDVEIMMPFEGKS